MAGSVHHQTVAGRRKRVVLSCLSDFLLFFPAFPTSDPSLFPPPDYFQHFNHSTALLFFRSKKIFCVPCVFFLVFDQGNLGAWHPHPSLAPSVFLQLNLPPVQQIAFAAPFLASSASSSPSRTFLLGRPPFFFISSSLLAFLWVCLPPFHLSFLPRCTLSCAVATLVNLAFMLLETLSSSALPCLLEKYDASYEADASFKHTKILPETCNANIVVQNYNNKRRNVHFCSLPPHSPLP